MRTGRRTRNLVQTVEENILHQDCIQILRTKTCLTQFRVVDSIVDKEAQNSGAMIAQHDFIDGCRGDQVSQQSTSPSLPQLWAASRTSV